MLALLLLTLVIIISAIFYKYLLKLKRNIRELALEGKSYSLLIEDLSLSNQKLQIDFKEMSDSTRTLLLETSQVSKQLEHRIKTLQQQNIDQQQLLIQWQNEQGQDKFYSRAFKLAEKGAGIDEIINECELPRAEAEMLMSVYRQRLGG